MCKYEGNFSGVPYTPTLLLCTYPTPFSSFPFLLTFSIYVP